MGVSTSKSCCDRILGTKAVSLPAGDVLEAFGRTLGQPGGGRPVGLAVDPERAGGWFSRLGTLDDLERARLIVEDPLGNRVEQRRVRHVEVERRGRDRETGRQVGPPPSQERDCQDDGGDDSSLPHSAHGVAYRAGRV